MIVEENRMKKFVYLSAALAFVGSLSLAGRTTFAAHSTAAMINVRLCTSAPINIGGDSHIVRGMWYGVEIATTNWRPQFRKAGMNLLKPLEMTDGKADGSAVDPAREASNARTCLSSPADFAYIGTLNSSMAQVSEPILDRGGMAMISPANSNPVLTSYLPKDRSTYEPLYFNHTLKYPTYYRDVNTDAMQSAVGALYMHNSLGITNFFLVDDQQTYGAGLAAHMAAFARTHLGMSEVGSGHLDTSSTSATATSAAAIAREVVTKNPQAVYCGCDEPYAGPMEKAARRAGYKGYFVGGDAINDVSFGTYAGGNANLYKTYSTFIGDPAKVTSVSIAFKSTEHRFFSNFTPGPYDGLSYDAANIALQAILKSKKAGTLTSGALFQRRSSILKYIATVHWQGTGGPISFDANGDLKTKLITVWQWSGSAWSIKKVYNNSNIPAFLKPTP
jgi:branched-chain amino acid transport system substrate-binding protein